MAAQVLELFPNSQTVQPPAKLLQKKPAKKEKYTAEFEAFWLPYPRKLNCSKLMAFRAWNRLDEDEQAQATTALPIFCRQQRGKDEQYIPHAATWLNQKRFETVAIPCTVPSAPPQIDWAKALHLFHATGRWNREFGPAPDETGYQGPAGIGA